MAKTLLDKQQENLKKAHEWEERIKEMGHPNEERGIKAVEEVQKEDEKKQDKKKADTLEQLTRIRQRYTDNEYKAGFVGWAQVALLGIKLPKDYFIYPQATAKGIVIWIRTDKNAGYAGGIEPSFIPEFDMRAIEDKIMEAIDFADILAKPDGLRTN